MDSTSNSEGSDVINDNREEGGGGPEGAEGPTEEDLDSDVGTIFSDEEEGKKLEDDDDDDDDDEGEEGGGELSDSSLSSKDDGAEKCPICLQKFTDQEIGSPEMCEHDFCLKCITAWSRKVATCPIDRKFFSTIIVKNELNGKVVRLEQVIFANAQTNSEEYDSDPTYCEVCGRCDREDRLLLCDGCDLGYHLECLEPPLEFVPIEEWLCPNCEAWAAQNSDGDDDDIVELRSVRPRQRSSPARTPSSLVPPRIPRTLQNERILQAIEPSIPAESMRAIDDVVETIVSAMSEPRPSTSSSRSRASRSVTQRKTRKSRKRSTRYRSTATGTTRKRRRKTRRRRRVAVDKKPNTARGRIAHQLGIMPPLPGQIYVGLPPATRASSSGSSSSNSFHSTQSTNSIINLRYSAGITPLRLFGGPPNDLSDLIDCYSDDEQGPTSQTARVSSVYRTGANNLKGPPGIIATRNSFPSTSSSTSVTSDDGGPPSCDILGGILKKQHILFNDKNIKIGRDGSLVSSISPVQLNDIVTNVTKNTTTTFTRTTTSTYATTHPNGTPSSRIGITTFGNERESSQPLGLPSYRQSTSSQAETGSGTSSVRNSYSSVSSSDSPHKASESSNSSQSQRTDHNFSASSDYWGSQKPVDDDDFDIYSDIEEQAIDDKTDNSTQNSTTTTDNDSPRKEANTKKENLSKANEKDKSNELTVPTPIRKSSRDSSLSGRSGDRQRHDSRDSEIDNMVIDEDDEHKSQSRSQSQSVNASPQKSTDGEPISVDVENTTGSAAAEFIDLPESIPLPDYPPPEEEFPKACGDNYQSDGAEIEKKSSTNKGVTSSSSQESPKRTVTCTKKSESTTTSKKGTQSPALANVPDLDIDLSNIPMPPEQNETQGQVQSQNQGRRPAIHFSIPKRHNLLPISTLLKRQKGIVRKESKTELPTTLNFQSEITKVFGGPSSSSTMGPHLNIEDEADGTEPKISLIAEIFGSDDEDEEMEDLDGLTATVIGQPLNPCMDDASVSQDGLPGEAQAVTGVVSTEDKPSGDPVIDVANSGRWKTVSEEVVPADSSDNPAHPRTTASKNQGTSQGQKQDQVSDHELEIIQIVTVNKCPPPRVPTLGLGPHDFDIETISDSDSDLEVIGEVGPVSNKSKTSSKGRPANANGKRDDGASRKNRSRSRSSSSSDSSNSNLSRSRVSVSQHKRRDGGLVRKRHHSQNSDNNDHTFFEEGEIDDRGGHTKEDSAVLASRKRKRRERERDRKRRTKQSRKRRDDSKRKKESGEETSSSLSVEDDVDNVKDDESSPRKKSAKREHTKESDDRVHPSHRHYRPRRLSKSPQTSSRSYNPRKGTRRGSCSPSPDPARNRNRRRSRTPEQSRTRSFAHRSSRNRNPDRGARKDESDGGGEGVGDKIHDSGKSSSVSPRKKLKRHKSRSHSRSQSPRAKDGSENRSKGDKKYEKHFAESLQKRKSSSKRKVERAAMKASKRAKERLKEKERRKSSATRRNEYHYESKTGKSANTAPSSSRDRRDRSEKDRRRRKKEKSLSPVKAIVAEGDSIVVSLSFQKDKENSSSSHTQSQSQSRKKVEVEERHSPIKSSSRKSGGSGSSGRRRDNHHRDESNDKFKGSSGKDKNNSESNSTARKSPTHHLKNSSLDLGTEDLTSTSESNDNDPSTGIEGGRDNNEFDNGGDSSSKVSSSGPILATDLPPPKSTPQKYYENEIIFKRIDPNIIPMDGLRKPEENLQSHEDSTVTSTRDSLSLESSGMTEDEMSSGAVSSPTSKGPGDGNGGGNGSSASQQTPVSTPKKISPPSQQGNVASPRVQQGTSSISSGVGSAPLSLTAGMLPPRFPPVPSPTAVAPPATNSTGTLLNPVLATVASALFSVRPPAPNTLGGMLGDQLRNRATAYSTMAARGNASNNNNSQPQQTPTKLPVPGMGGGESPISPTSSDGDDLFEPPSDNTPPSSAAAMKSSSGQGTAGRSSSSNSGNPKRISSLFDTLFGDPLPPKQQSSSSYNNASSSHRQKPTGRPAPPPPQLRQPQPPIRASDLLSEDNVPASAVELSVQEKLLKKLNRQERVVEEVKLCLKPHYVKKYINKDDYKEILRRAVPKICHSKTGEINPQKVRELVEAYVRKFRHNRRMHH